jgi:hypothetical protein
MTAPFRGVRPTPSVATLVPPAGAHGVFFAALPFAVVVGVAIVDVLAGPGVGFLPVLSLGPALAAISRPPLPTALIGMLALASGVLLAIYDDLAGSRRGIIALATITGVTVAGVVASSGRRRRERELADFKAIADAAQQILLRPVPGTIPPVDIAVRYVSAVASARIGGDLYEAIPAGGGVRLIVGDVLGKGLPAARTAAVVLGAFRESAYDAGDLAQIAARIEASLQHQEADSARGHCDSPQARGPAAVLHRRDQRGTRQVRSLLPDRQIRLPSRAARPGLRTRHAHRRRPRARGSRAAG